MTRELWLGDDSSHGKYLFALNQITQAIQANNIELYASDEDESVYGDYEYLLTDYDGISVLSINGVLTNENWRYNRYFGLISYEEISNAAITAVEAGAKALILHVNSPGGAAMGVNSASKTLEEVSKVIPVSTYTDGMMASGGYWLGCNGNEIWSDEMAMVGSIGVITTMVSYHEMLKKEGIDAKVLRAGEFKALGQPYEPLSEKAVKDTQDRIDEIYDVFLNHVSSKRGMTRDALIEQAAEGRVFLGRKAVGVGLVDRIGSLSDMVGAYQKRYGGSNDSTYVSLNQPEGEETMAKKKLLTEEQIAALASGATEEEVIAASGGPDEEENVAETADEPEVKAGEESAAETADEPEVKDGPAPAAVAAPNDQLTSLVDQVVSLRVESASKDAKIATLEAELASAMVCVKEATTRLMVPLNAKMDISTFSNGAVIESYKNLVAQFNETFKVGAQAKVAVDTDQSQSGGRVDDSVASESVRGLTTIGRKSKS